MKTDRNVNFTFRGAAAETREPARLFFRVGFSACLTTLDFRNWIPHIPGKSKDRRCARFSTLSAAYLPRPLPNGQTAAGKTQSRVSRLPSSISNLRDLCLNVSPSLSPFGLPILRAEFIPSRAIFNAESPIGDSELEPVDSREERATRRAIPATQRSGLRAAVASRHR